jgi:hypothetical protein
MSDHDRVRALIKERREDAAWSRQYGNAEHAPMWTEDAAALERVLKDAERYRWLRASVTYYNVDADWPVEAPNIPVHAQVSDRIWYHATDDVLHNTLDDTIDAALAKGE